MSLTLYIIKTSRKLRSCRHQLSSFWNYYVSLQLWRFDSWMFVLRKKMVGDNKTEYSISAKSDWSIYFNILSLSRKNIEKMRRRLVFFLSFSLYRVSQKKCPLARRDPISQKDVFSGTPCMKKQWLTTNQLLEIN